MEEKKEIVIPEEVTKLAEERVEAKQAKDYAKADELRDKVADMGFEIKDTPEGFTLNAK